MNIKIIKIPENKKLILDKRILIFNMKFTKWLYKYFRITVINKDKLTTNYILLDI